MRGNCGIVVLHRHESLGMASLRFNQPLRKLSCVGAQRRMRAGKASQKLRPSFGLRLGEEDSLSTQVRHAAHFINHFEQVVGRERFGKKRRSHVCGGLAQCLVGKR